MTLWIFSNLVICERLREIQYPTSTTHIGLLAKYPSRLGQFMKLNQSAMSKKMEKRIDDHIHICFKLLNLLEMSLDIRLLITRPGANPTWRERSFWNTLVIHHSSPRIFEPFEPTIPESFIEGCKDSMYQCIQLPPKTYVLYHISIQKGWNVAIHTQS